MSDPVRKYSHSNIDADSDATEVKATAGRWFWLHVATLELTPAFLKLYDKPAAQVNAAVDVPKFVFVIPADGDERGAGFTINFGDEGSQFDTALSYRVTKGVEHNDTSAPAAKSVIVNAAFA